MKQSDIIIGADYAYSENGTRHRDMANTVRVKVTGRAERPAGKGAQRRQQRGFHVSICTPDGVPKRRNVFTMSRYLLHGWEVEVVARKAKLKLTTAHRARMQANESTWGPVLRALRLRFGVTGVSRPRNNSTCVQLTLTIEEARQVLEHMPEPRNFAGGRR